MLNDVLNSIHKAPRERLEHRLRWQCVVLVIEDSDRRDHVVDSKPETETAVFLSGVGARSANLPEGRVLTYRWRIFDRHVLHWTQLRHHLGISEEGIRVCRPLGGGVALQSRVGLKSKERRILSAGRADSALVEPLPAGSSELVG